MPSQKWTRRPFCSATVEGEPLRGRGSKRCLRAGDPLALPNKGDRCLSVGRLPEGLRSLPRSFGIARKAFADLQRANGSDLRTATAGEWPSFRMAQRNSPALDAVGGAT